MRNKKRRCKLKNCWSHGYNYWNAGKTSARHELLSNGLSRFTGQRDNNQIFILLLSLKDRPIPLPMLCFSSQSLSNDKNSWQELYRNETTPNSHWLCRKKGLHTKLLRNNSHKEDTTPSKKKYPHFYSWQVIWPSSKWAAKFCSKDPAFILPLPNNSWEAPSKAVNSVKLLSSRRCSKCP